MIPTPDYLGLFYPSKELAAPNAALPDRVVTTGSSMLNIVTTSLSEATDFWNGAVGFFCGQSTASLRGVTFHVRKWNKETNTLQITSPLPIAPVAGDMFKIFVGGKTPSSFEVLAMKVSGKQPEVDTVAGTNVTGGTIKKVSAMLGEGTLTLYYAYSTRILRIRMGTDDYGPDTVLSGDAQNVPIFAKDLSGYILVDINFAALRSSGTYSDTFTLTVPKGNLIPNFEGFETNDGFGRTRYHLVVAKNKAASPLDAMNCFSIWTGRPSGTATIISANYAVSYSAPQTMTASNASDWPSRGFWLRNKTKNDFRYVDYRSGNTLYTKALDWGTLPFKNAQAEILPLPTIYNLRSSLRIGTRTIQWSALPSEVDDCLFGIWYSAESPVDTARPPDATVWYSSSMAEYQTTFVQKAPAWVAIAVIRPGNDSEIGRIHELYLDWNNAVPRPPDDVMALPEPLSIFETNIQEQAIEEDGLRLAF